MKIRAVLDPQFRPMALETRNFNRDVAAAPHQPIAVSIVRNDGYTETMRMDVFREGDCDARNLAYVERIVKTLLWTYGGYRIVIAGSRAIYEHIRDAYTEGGARSFDKAFMEHQYECPFEVIYLENPDDAPETLRCSRSTGRHLNGCRIGFDAGGSDRKVSAVVDGETVYSEEVVWHPKLSADPDYQYQGILDSMRTAASKMPRVDGIGVSSAGTFMNNQVRTSSLFIKVPKELYESRVKCMYLDIAREFGPDVPIEVANDGDVTALAGAMDLDANCVLGIAMGTSEAGGYVDANGNITGWLNELAFVPVDACPEAMVDEWSGDYGCGVKYFSQDAVIKLAPAAGIELDAALTPAEKLKAVQSLMAQGDPRAKKIYETIGVYFGYSVAYYAQFYDLEHVLVMGRVTSGEGGVLLLERAKEVLQAEFPELARKVVLSIPDESSRRVGQSIAAASLPEVPV